MWITLGITCVLGRNRDPDRTILPAEPASKQRQIARHAVTRAAALSTLATRDVHARYGYMVK